MTVPKASDSTGEAVSSVMLASVVGTVVAGAIADRRGPRAPYGTGLVIFAVGLLISATANGWEMFLLGRLVQGLGVGAIMSMAYVAVALVCPAGLQARALALLSGAWTVPSLIGPMISSVLAEAASWRILFYALIPLVALAGLVTLRGLPEPSSAGSAETRGRVSRQLMFTDTDGDEVQPLAGMHETAFAFYDSLTDEQKAELYQGSQVSDLVCAPGDTCDYPTGTGLSGAHLTSEQRQLLLDVIANWVGLSDDETTAAELAEIEATLDETFVNWSGATAYNMTEGDGIYVQISGPDVYIEFSNQQGSAGADVDGSITSGWGHIHTIYRDPTDDYAGSVSQQAASGMGGGPGGGTPPSE